MVPQRDEIAIESGDAGIGTADIGNMEYTKNKKKTKEKNDFYAKPARKAAISALLVSVALLLSYLESMLPPFPVPGIKPGLANIAILIALYRMGAGAALSVNLARILLAGFLFGSPVSIIYSISGALLSLLIMIILKRTGVFSEVGVSMAGGVFHNIGQTAAATLLMQEIRIFYYYTPFLMLAGIVTGIFVGFSAAAAMRRMP